MGTIHQKPLVLVLGGLTVQSVPMKPAGKIVHKSLALVEVYDTIVDELKKVSRGFRFCHQLKTIGYCLRTTTA